MPKKELVRAGYRYVTACLEADDFALLEAYAEAKQMPITRAVGELVHRSTAHMLAVGFGQSVAGGGIDLTQETLELIRAMDAFKAAFMRSLPADTAPERAVTIQGGGAGDAPAIASSTPAS